MTPTTADSPVAPTERAASIFRFPSETTQRFFLLVGAVLLTSLFTYESLYYTVHFEREVAVSNRCREEAKRFTGVADQDREFECRALTQRSRILWTAQFLPLTLGTTLAIGAVLPVLRRRRRKLVPLPDVVGLQERVDQLANRLDLTRRPRISWQPRRVGGAASAFGLPQRPELEVSPGTVVLGAVDRLRCDAILGHELAHLRNRDILIGGFTAASFAAVVVVAVLPFVAGLVLGRLRYGLPAWTIPVSLARLAVVAALVAVVQRGVLRAREHEADVRAASAGIDVSPAIDDHPSPATVRRRLTSPLESHPPSASRLCILRDPALLLRLAPLQAAAAGFLAFLPIPTLSRLTSGYIYASSPTTEGFLWAAGLMAVPLGPWLAVALLRGSAAFQRRPRSSLSLGACVGAGGVAALLLYQEPLYQKVTLLPGGMTELLALGVLASALAGFVVWLSTLARHAAEVLGSGRHALVVIILAGAVGSALIVGQLARVWHFARITDAGSAVGKDPALAVAELLLTNVATPWVVLLLVALAAAPFLLRDARPRGRTKFALAVVGVVGGLLGFVAFKLMDERLVRIAIEEIREQRLVTIRVSILGSALIAAGAVAAFLASTWSFARRRLDLGLGCAMVAVLAGSVAMLLYHHQRGIDVDARQVRNVVVPIAVLSLLGCLCAGACALAQPPGPRWLGPALVTVLVLIAAPVASAYAAAPARLLSEAPAFVQWLETEGAPVLAVLDMCEDAATDPPLDSQAEQLARLSTGAIDAVPADRWRSDGFRRATTLLRASLTSCRDGSLAASAGRVEGAKATFTHTLCLSGEFAHHLTGIEGRPAQKVPAFKLICGS